MTTNTKAIIQKNQKYLLSLFSAREYGTRSNAEAFVKAVDKARDRHKTRYGLANPYKAIYEMFSSEGFGPVYYYRMAEYLKSIGLTDEKRLWKTDDEPGNIFCHLMARDGSKLYESLKAGKNPVAPKKVAKKKSGGSKISPFVR